MAADEQQQSLGWTDKEVREREELIGKLRLPKSVTVPGEKDDGGVARDKILSLLYRLNFEARGGPVAVVSQSALAKKMGVSTKTIKRAVKVCVDRGFLRKDREKDDDSQLAINHYEIDWDVVRKQANRVKPESASVPSGPAAPGDMTEQGAAGTGSRAGPGDMAAEEKCHGGTGEVTRRPGESDTPAGRRDMASPHYGIGNGVQNFKAPSTPSLSAGREKRAPVFEFSWGWNVPRDALRDPVRIESLYRTAVRYGAAKDTEVERQAFFALVAYVVQQRLHAGFLLELVRLQRWNKWLDGKDGRDPFDWRHRIRSRDEDQAGKWLKQLERPPEPPKPAPSSYEAELEQERSVDEAVLAERRRVVAEFREKILRRSR